MEQSRITAAWILAYDSVESYGVVELPRFVLASVNAFQFNPCVALQPDADIKVRDARVASPFEQWEHVEVGVEGDPLPFGNNQIAVRHGRVAPEIHGVRNERVLGQAKLLNSVHVLVLFLFRAVLGKG